MNILLPSSIILMAVLLSGCPDSNLPKAPPKVPEPKASLTDTPATSPTPPAPPKSAA